jgi:hypothetical protein
MARKPGPWRPGKPPRGNTWAVTHGAYSQRAIEAKAAEVHDELLVVAPWLTEDRFIPSTHRYLTAAAREALLHDHIMKVAEEKGAGAIPSRVFEQATAAARLANQLAEGLGLTVKGHAQIRLLLSSADATDTKTVTDLARTGRAIRRKATRRLALDSGEVETQENEE